jgi:hypothetical protein
VARLSRWVTIRREEDNIKLHLKIGVGLWTLFIRLKRWANVVQRFGFCLDYSRLKKFLERLNASQIRRRTVFNEGRDEKRKFYR